MRLKRSLKRKNTMKTTVVVEFSHYEYEQLLALIEGLASTPLNNKCTKAEEAELRSLIQPGNSGGIVCKRQTSKTCNPDSPRAILAPCILMALESRRDCKNTEC